MGSNVRKAWRVAAAVAGLLLGTAGHASAQQTLTGVYRSRMITLELTADGRAAVSSSTGPMSIGSYRVVLDTIALRDERGGAACLGESGLYLWRLDADTLSLRVVTDPCEYRRALLAMRWTQASASMPAVAELDAVVITAQRQVQDVQRAPVAVTVLSAKDIRDGGLTQPQQLTYMVPGLQVGSLPGNSAMLYMRGVGNFAGTSMQDPTITFNFNGVYIARPTSTSGLFYDLERVEALKGPQGTLYGRNATGGAINILPRRPVLQTFTGELGLEYGSYNGVLLDGAINAPLGDRAAVRVAGQRVRHDAYMNDGTDDQDDWAARLSLRFDATDALSFRMVADYFDQRGRGPGATPVALNPDSRIGVSSPEGGAYYATQRVSIAGRNWFPLPPLQHSNNQHRGLSANIEWQSGLGALTVIPALRRSDLDVLNTPAGNLVLLQEHGRQASLEARLVSVPHPRVQTLVGAFHFDEAIDTFSRPHNQFNFSLQKPTSGTTSDAAFGRVTWSVTDNFRATLGGRYTHETKDLRGTFQSFNRVCPPGPPASCPNAQPFPADILSSPLVFPPDSVMAIPVFNPSDGTLTTGFQLQADETASFTQPTWRAALERDLAEHALVFASYETGFKSGGFFFSNDSKVYKPEHVGALTLGLKSRLAANRLQANVELFSWRYRDQQVSKLSLDSRGVTNLRTENIGQASIRGVEGDFEYALLTGTQLSANVQYLDAVYDSYVFLTPAPPVTACDQSQTTNGFLVDCSGRRAPYAPEWTLTFGVVHSLRFPGGSGVTVRSRARYQSETLMGLDFLPEQHQDGYWMLDASLTVGSARDRYSIGLYGQNLTNRTVLSNTFVVPFSTFTVGALRPPRTVGLRMGTRL